MPKWNLKIAIFFQVSTMFYAVAESCNATFSATGPISRRAGTIGTIGFPKPYPPGVTCEFRFINSAMSRLHLSFTEFDLRDEEPDSGGQCAFDFVDIFLIETDNTPMRMLQRRCGNKPPQQLTTSASRVIVYFKSRSQTNEQYTGFRADFSFSNDSIVLPPSFTEGEDSICGVSRLRGTGGILTAPTLHGSREVQARQRMALMATGMINCTWTIRISEGDQILINFLSINLGPSEVVCRDSYLLMYNSVSDFEKLGSLEKICGRLSLYPGKSKEYVSTGPWLTIRYIHKLPKHFNPTTSETSPTASSSMTQQDYDSTIKPTMSSILSFEPTFRLVWTAIWNLKPTEECPGFECTGRQSCLDAGKIVCHKTPRYCVHPTLRCDGIPHCGPQDTSDEENCQLPLILSGVAAGVGILLTLIATVAIVVWRVRMPNHRRTKARPVRNSSSRIKPGAPPNLARMLEHLADKKNATTEYTAVITNQHLVNTRSILNQISQQEGGKTAVGDGGEPRPVLIKPSVIVNRHAGLVSVRFAAATPPGLTPVEETRSQAAISTSSSALHLNEQTKEPDKPSLPQPPSPPLSMPKSVSIYENPLQVDQLPLTAASEQESGSIAFPPPPSNEEMVLLSTTPPITITPQFSDLKNSSSSSSSAKSRPGKLPLNGHNVDPELTFPLNNNHNNPNKPASADAKAIAKLLRDTSMNGAVLVQPSASGNVGKTSHKSPSKSAVVMTSPNDFQWELRTTPGATLDGRKMTTTTTATGAASVEVEQFSLAVCYPHSSTAAAQSPAAGSQSPDSLAASPQVSPRLNRKRSTSSRLSTSTHTPPSDRHSKPSSHHRHHHHRHPQTPSNNTDTSNPQSSMQTTV